LDPLRQLHLGLEFGRSFFSRDNDFGLQVGISEGYLTSGAFLDMWAVRMNLAYYAAELGEYGIRVNGINPDGVVQGSGIFASGWGANRAAVYGVEEEKLGAFYAQRSILKLEVLPSHIAAAAFAFVAGDLPLTTGSHIPVDSGVASAFLR
jgi:NAD(P)-dependent dehydrogenase (short-subunit alcohol dehydrogenase family)